MLNRYKSCELSRTTYMNMDYERKRLMPLATAYFSR
jgi:hypothetical protein